MVASLSEAKISEYSVSHDSQGQSLVRGFEGAKVDFGVYNGPIQLTGNPTENLLTVLDSGDAIIPIEAKDVSPCNHKGLIQWSFSLTKGQKNCQAVVVTAAADPAFVALIPLHWFRHKIGKMLANESEALHIYSKAIQPYATLHQLPAFPPEWSPFMMPITDLAMTWRHLRAVSSGTSSW